jgi:hypothetical protein
MPEQTIVDKSPVQKNRSLQVKPDAPQSTNKSQIKTEQPKQGVLKKDLLDSVKKQQDGKKSTKPNQDSGRPIRHEHREQSLKEEIIGMPKYETEWTRNRKVELIEIKIRKINQLFNSLDPSPFLEKDLDDDACEYIVSSVAEYPLKTKQKIVIYIPKYEKKKISEQDISRAMRHFFEYKELLAEKSIRLKLQEGQQSMIIGVIFLATCIFLRSLMPESDDLMMHIIAEGLSIGGWVAMWKPISDILYEWWPSHKEKKIYNKISKMDIEFKWMD